MNKSELKQFVREHIIQSDISYRGGSLKVDASALFPTYTSSLNWGEKAIVGAYQNYLGGGIAGAIVGAAMFGPDELANTKERKLFPRVLEACQEVFFEINNGGGDEYMQENYASYAFNQQLPVRGY